MKSCSPQRLFADGRRTTKKTRWLANLLRRLPSKIFCWFVDLDFNGVTISLLNFCKKCIYYFHAKIVLHKNTICYQKCTFLGSFYSKRAKILGLSYWNVCKNLNGDQILLILHICQFNNICLNLECRYIFECLNNEMHRVQML